MSNLFYAENLVGLGGIIENNNRMWDEFSSFEVHSI